MQELNPHMGEKSPSINNADFCHIGDDFQFVGTISGSGLCIISGVVEGTLNLAKVKVNHGARVLGEINCVQLDVAGGVHGKIATEDIFLRASAIINGDLNYRSITIEKGAEIEGDIRRLEVPSINKGINADKDVGAIGLQDEIANSDNIKEKFDDFYQLLFPLEIQELMVDAREVVLKLDDGLDHPELFELQSSGVLVNLKRFEEHLRAGGSSTLKLMVGDKLYTLDAGAGINKIGTL